MSLVWRIRAAGLTLAALVVGIDQWIKAQVVGQMGLDQVGESIPVLPFFALTRTNNYGVSLGMLPATSAEMRWILVLATSALALGVLVALLRARRAWDIAALALILGGALGNIRDRYLFGYVIDFLDFQIGGFRPFMIFNIADAAITLGAVFYLAGILFVRKRQGIASAVP